MDVRVESMSEIFKHLPDAYAKKVEEFVFRISSQIEEGYYPIDGDNIYARVMSYSTSPREKCKIEAHNDYVDIQATLIGSEGIEIFDRNSLQIEEPYNSDQDVEFYKESSAPYLFVDNQPGRFSMIFPNEAHRPQISINGKNETVKKFVIKIKKDLFVC